MHTTIVLTIAFFHHRMPLARELVTLFLTYVQLCERFLIELQHHLVFELSKDHGGEGRSEGSWGPGRGQATMLARLVSPASVERVSCSCRKPSSSRIFRASTRQLKRRKSMAWGGRLDSRTENATRSSAASRGWGNATERLFNSRSRTCRECKTLFFGCSNA